MTEQRFSFDPECIVWASFGELQVGDRVDYWGDARPVLEMERFPGEVARVRIIVDNGIGRDMALAPEYEGTWRAQREGER